MMSNKMLLMKRFMNSFRFLILILLATRLYAFDHQYQEYGEVLKAYVKNGLVDYAALQKNRIGIDHFVKQIGAVNAEEYQSWSRDQQLSFWINTYNGWFLQIVIDRYPIRGSRILGLLYPENSVQRIPGIWDNVRTKAAGRDVSLNDIEHKILRPIFQEPRIHFSIVCASLGCPLLRSEPFRPDVLQSQLEDAAKAFINNSSKVRWNPDRNTLQLSSIFDWFADDFQAAADESWRKLYSKKNAGPVAFVSKYLPAEVAAALHKSEAKIDHFDYDWTLNDSRSTTQLYRPISTSTSS
jgi:hypothetical protein